MINLIIVYLSVYITQGFGTTFRNIIKNKKPRKDILLSCWVIIGFHVGVALAPAISINLHVLYMRLNSRAYLCLGWGGGDTFPLS